MKTRIAALALASLVASGPAAAQNLSELTQPPNGNNQRAEVSQWIGPVRVTIAYHSPRVHGGGPGAPDRTGHIWGGLLPYGLFDEGFGPSKATPWRAGANESTTIAFSHGVRVEGQALAAGTYGLFLELRESGPWFWIFSKRATGWGSYQYDPRDEALRVGVSPLEARQTEFLTYGFDARGPSGATAFLEWDNRRVPFRVEVPDVDELYVDQMRKDLESWPGFNYQNWQIAAQFCADHRINLDEALVWADKAISEPFRNAAQGREDFSTLGTKAAVLRAMGRTAEADAIVERGVHLPGTPARAIHQRARSLLAAGQSERALDLFKYNREQHPDDTFITYMGLALGYTAVGNRKDAITNWELALANVPASQEANRSSFEKALAALKKNP